MIFDRIYAQNSVIGAAMQASSLRNDVIVNNIANADVPGYKKKTVDFEVSLREALDDAKSTGVLDLSSISPSVSVFHDNFNYRIDENNVDIELEMVDLYQNSVKYDTMTSSILNNSKKLNLVLAGR